jgi:hypothetical protein
VNDNNDNIHEEERGSEKTLEQEDKKNPRERELNNCFVLEEEEIIRRRNRQEVERRSGLNNKYINVLACVSKPKSHIY